MPKRTNPDRLVTNLSVVALLLSCAVSLGGCGATPDGKGKGQLTKLRIQPPERADTVPTPKKLPDNIFSSDIESVSLSPEAFTKDYATAVQRATGIRDVVTEAPLIVKIKVHPNDSKSCKIDLHKIWQKCKDTPGSRSKTIEPGITALFDMVNFVTKPLNGEELADKVVPLVRDRNALEKLMAQHGGSQKLLADRFKEGDNVYYEAIAGGLYIVYSVHDPSGIRLLDKDYYRHHLALKAEALKSRSIQNLERLTTSNIKIEADGPIFRVLTDDNYEPSLILSDRVIAILHKRVAGRLVASLPDHNILLICGDETPGGLLKIKEATAEAFKKGKFKISDKLFIRDQGQWKIFTAFPTN